MTSVDDIYARQLREIFHPIFVDQRERERVTSTPEIVEVTGENRDEELLRMGGLTDTPTVVLFLTRSGSSRLDDVRHAIDDPDAARALALQFALDTEKRQESPMNAAVQDLLDANGGVQRETARQIRLLLIGVDQDRPPALARKQPSKARGRRRHPLTR